MSAQLKAGEMSNGAVQRQAHKEMLDGGCANVLNVDVLLQNRKMKKKQQKSIKVL